MSMETMPWNDELNKLAKAIEPYAIATLRRIQQNGMVFNDQFKALFLDFIGDRICQAYDRVQLFEENQNAECHGKGLKECVMVEKEDLKDVEQQNQSMNSNQNIADIDLKQLKHIESMEVSENTELIESETISVAQQMVESIEMKKHKPELSTDIQLPDLLMNLDELKSLDSGIVDDHGSSDNQLIFYDKRHSEENKVESSIQATPDECIEDVCKDAKLEVVDELSANELSFNCAYCNKMIDNCTSSIELVYQHWLSVHSPQSQPFQFSVSLTMCCFYCDLKACFHDLMKHHHKHHATDIFVTVNIADKLKCGMCPWIKFKDKPSLVEHFNSEHETLLQISPKNPILLNDEMLAKLLNINANRYQCINCDRLFETQNEVEFHHTIDHTELQLAINTIPKSIEPQLICGYCNVKIPEREKYLDHIENHDYEFHCSKCDFKTGKTINLVMHDKQKHRSNTLNYRCLEFGDLLKGHFAKTKVIFENGLVLFNYNLMHTKFGNSKVLFDIFTDELMRIMKAKYKSKEKVHDGNENAVTEKMDKGFTSKLIKKSSILTRAANIKALHAQNRLINNLCIYGFPYMENENKMMIFLSLCAKLQAHVYPHDIVRIIRSPGRNHLLIVELKSFEVKERILKCAYMKTIWSTDLIPLPMNIQPTRIFINIHTTKFYGRMAKIARNAMKNNQLHIFWITKYGFLVKRTPKSQDKIVFSPDELINYINNRNDSNSIRIHREKRFYRPIQWVYNSNNGNFF